LVVAASVALVAFAQPLGAANASERHGSTDRYVGDGVALAWAVLRGANEASTRVVIRIRSERYGAVSIAGADPFSNARETLVASTALESGGSRFTLPRARFADLPRTEFRFHENVGTGPNDSPALVIYYLGVPDTTPEFIDQAKLDAYLASRLDAQPEKPR
jgi:hypothetical protein